MTETTSLDDASLDDRKAALRRHQGQVRAAAAKADPEAADRLASYAANLVEAIGFGAGAVIAGYWPIRSELTPLPLMRALTKRGLETALPATPTPGQPLVFHRWQEGDDLIDGLYGTSEPAASAPQCLPDGLLVPMLAFDAAGFRLGYGGGFYDRSLAAIRPQKPAVKAIGIAYQEQLVEAVPVGVHDARLDAILTPSGLILPAPAS